MRKIIKLLTATLTIAALTCSLALSSSAASGGKVVYKNDFNSGGELDDTMYYLQSGTCKITTEFGEQFLRCTPATSGTRRFGLNFGPAEAKNVDISFRVRARGTQTASGAFLGIYFRSFAIPSHALFSYQLKLNESKAALVHMNNHYDTTTTTVTEDPNYSIKAGLWNNVKVCLREERIVVYFNGAKVMDVESDLNPVKGGFGICGIRYIFDVDDIVMTQYTGKTLPEPEPNDVPLWKGADGTDEEEDFADTGEERLNLFGTGGEAVDTTVSYVDPNKLTINSWIAIGLIIALVLMAASTLVVALLFVKSKKQDSPAMEETPADQNDSDKEVE